VPEPVNLELYVGPAVPIPVSKTVLDALTSVTITAAAKGPSVFELQFELSTRSPLHTLFLVSAGAPIPIVRVVVAVRIGGRRHVLIDGVMTHHEVGRGSRPGTATLSVIGEDLSRVLDLIDFSGIPYPAMPDFARVLLILAKYAFLGIIPKVIPSVLLDVPIPIESIPTHKGTDLAYINALADRVGYAFYLEPGPEVGTSIAFWGPEVKVGREQRALSLDFDAHSTVMDLRFSYDASKATLPIVWIHNQQTKVPIPIPVPDITPLSPPLGAIPALPLRIEPITETAKYSPLQGVIVGMAKAAQASGKVVTGKGTLDVRGYGRLLEPRKLVGVRGAGKAFDGLHYVDSVTSRISRGEFKQDFELSRNGLLSTVDTVAVA
jgi:hypothetical protein